MSFVSLGRALGGCQFSPVFIVCLWSLMGLVGPLVAQQPLAKWVVSNDENDKPYVQVSGLTVSQWQVLGDSTELNENCAVRIVGKNNVPPVLGRFERNESYLRFTPRFSLLPGKRYVVQFSVDGGADAEDITAIEFQVPQADTSPPKVTTIYPTGDVLPENILKFYLHFSRPMQPGNVYRFIELIDEDDRLVEAPFLEIEQELWSRDGTRLTLLIDPGRIKRGLAPRAQMGPVFEDGVSYRLRIKKVWTAENGVSFEQDFVKKFRIAGTDNTQPDPGNWKTQIPPPGTRHPVEIKFEESLDHGLLKHIAVIEKTTSEEVEVTGEVKIGAQEKSWRFVPARRWQPGQYELRINTVLEDLCGNSIGQPFDVDTAGEPGATEPKSDFVTIDFKIPAVR